MIYSKPFISKNKAKAVYCQPSACTKEWWCREAYRYRSIPSSNQLAYELSSVLGCQAPSPTRLRTLCRSLSSSTLILYLSYFLFLVYLPLIIVSLFISASSHPFAFFLSNHGASVVYIFCSDDIDKCQLHHEMLSLTEEGLRCIPTQEYFL